MLVQFAFKVDFNSAYQAMWGQITEISTPKVLAVRPNLREWWVGEKISLDNDERRWVVDCVWQSKKDNGQFDLPCEGGKSEIGSLHGVPAWRKRTLVP